MCSVFIFTMNILFSEHFKRQLKKLQKKYPHIKEDLLMVVDDLNLQNEVAIGRSIYKIRVPSTDMQRGKSGGFRSYMYLYVKKELLVPLCMYPKSETESITENELKYHFDQTMQEILRSL